MRRNYYMKIFKMVISIIILLSLSACGNDNIDNSHDAYGSTPTIASSEPKKAVTNNKSDTTHPYIANERDPHIKRDLVGDPMEAYFVSDDYKTKSTPESKNPIYSKNSFINGTYPLDENALDYKTTRVIVIHFKEDIDVNYLYNTEKPVIIIKYGKNGKDVTKSYNFTYDSVTQKLLITSKSAGNGFGSGNFIEIIINGDNLCTAEIQDTNIKYADGKTEHILGQRSRQLSGTYSFRFYT
jgi:hypothetical protein